jgi:hypothetical protein
MPCIYIDVYEFVPRGNDLLAQIQYIIDPKTRQKIGQIKQSPPLGMKQIKKEEIKCHQYVSKIVNNHIDLFGQLCWKEEDNSFHRELFALIANASMEEKDDAKLVHNALSLVVTSFIMSRTLTLDEDTKAATISRMSCYDSQGGYLDNYTSPRLTNRQIKYSFFHIEQSTQAAVLQELQNIFESSKACDRWQPAFIAVLCLSMALEDRQKTVHLIASTNAATQGKDVGHAQAEAESACRTIDSSIQAIHQSYWSKCGWKHSPNRGTDLGGNKETGIDNRDDACFTENIARLVKDNR